MVLKTRGGPVNHSPKNEHTARIAATLKTRHHCARTRNGAALHIMEVKDSPPSDVTTSGLAYLKNGILIDCNQELLDLLVYRQQDVLGRTFSDLSPVQQADGQHSIEKAVTMSSIVETEGSQSFKWQLKKSTGGLVTVDVHFALLSDPPDITILATIDENREPGHPDKALQLPRDWAETIFHSIQSGVFIIDIESHRIIDINRAAGEMIGLTRREIIGNICHKFVCPKARGDCPISDRNLQIHNAESVLVRKDGSQIPILKTVNSITLQGRECLIESFVDISALKNAEEDALAHQKRFQTFFSSVKDAIFVHPLQEEGFAPFVEVNDSACERYGYTRDEFLRLTARDITLESDVKIHADASYRKKLRNARRMFFEAVHISKSGEQFPVEINSNIVEQYGKPVILSVVRDISERKQAEKDKVLIEAQYRQSQKVEAIGRLAGGVAHDLNNMLSPIIGYSELLIHDIGPDSKRGQFAHQIVQAGHRARDLVHQLLAFGRKQTLEYKTIDLNGIIRKFEDLLCRTIREDIDLEFQLATDCRPIKADSGQIEQVIMNLCVNAQDAMPEGGKLTLTTSVVEISQSTREQKPDLQSGTYVMLSIKDSGYGMNHEILEHIFEPFYSTKGKQGTGLGLSTVYGIVKQHNGELWVDTARGEGSEFKIYLPASTPASGSVEIVETAGHAPQGTETILLVEDNKQVRDLNNLVLTKQGYNVQIAVDGVDALRIIEKGCSSFDLLLTDVVMPGMNGRELYSRVSEIIPDIKVIYMSGYTDDVIAHHGVLDQGINFIQKPFSIDALTVKVREVIDNH